MPSRDKLLAEWFWTDRWMGSSGFLLPMEARGVYREMLTQSWRRGAQLPNDHAAIQRAIGATAAEWERSWPLIERFWRVDGANLVNDTQLAVYHEAKFNRDKATERARAAAQAMHKQRSSTAQAVLEQCPPSPSPSPSLISVSSNTKIATLRGNNGNGHANTKAPSARPVKELPDPEVNKFLKWFQIEYRERRHGADYLVKWEKDAPIVKRLLKATKPERLRNCAIIMLSEKTDEPFIVESDRGIGVLSAKFNWLSDRLAAWESSRKH